MHRFWSVRKYIVPLVKSVLLSVRDWHPYFLVLFMSSTILFQLTFIFIYSTFSKKFSISTKAVFVLTSNHFCKCFSVNAGVWLRMENGFSGKEFQLTVKLRPLTQKIFSAKILPSNHFRRRAKRERERERTHMRKQKEREIANPENPRSSHHRRVAPQTHEPEIVAPRTHKPWATPRRLHRWVAPQTHKLANPLPISFTFSFEIFVIKFVCDFDFLLSLFDLWFLLLLWWCFGGFPVVWWWVLCGWWWKKTFSRYYKTHENIF